MTRVQNRSRNYGYSCPGDYRTSGPSYVAKMETPVAATVARDALGTLAGYISDMVPAMAYVPTQVWGDVYCPEEGLARGTIFAVLDKPFVGRQGGCCR